MFVGSGFTSYEVEKPSEEKSLEKDSLEMHSGEEEVDIDKPKQTKVNSFTTTSSSSENVMKPKVTTKLEEGSESVNSSDKAIKVVDTSTKLGNETIQESFVQPNLTKTAKT